MHCWGLAVTTLQPAFHCQLCSLSPRLPRQHFPEPSGLYFSLVTLTLLLFCCGSHGLAPSKSVSVIIADSHFCHWHENTTFLPRFFLSLVVAFSLHYGSMHIHRAYQPGAALTPHQSILPSVLIAL